jgi:hypothetical protein
MMADMSARPPSPGPSSSSSETEAEVIVVEDVEVVEVPAAAVGDDAQIVQVREWSACFALCLFACRI